ncbi:MAG: hypothetical protein IJL21_02380 [Alphaproteobacteria bacterium]|nr:hypothetical protein [Alphaproteobacteria bacterium]
MKVKIRGLVFVGFAAAVFAQSAFADDATDKKTVTSKYYVDHTFQTLENITTASEAQGEGAWDSDTTYPSMAAVKSKFNDINVTVANNSNATDYLDVTETPDGTFTLNLDNAPAMAATDLTGTLSNGVATAPTGNNLKKLVTVGAVNALVDGESTAGTTTINENSTNGTVPTSKNVYDYVEGKVGNAAYQRKLTADDTGTLYIGQYDANASGTDKSTWKELSVANASGQNPALASTNYVAKTVSGNVYTVNLDAAQIADSIATDASQKLVTENAVYDLVDRESTAGTSTIGSQSTTLVPTSKNVYDFVTTYAADNYQPIIDTARANKIMIGYNTATTNGGNTTYSSDWKELVGDYVYQNSTDVGYIQVDVNPEATGQVEVRLQNVGHAGSVISSATSSDVTNGTDKLASAYAVQQYVSTMMGGLEIPPMSDACTTAIALNNGHYCALVAGYDATDGVKLEWTVMAPTE